MSGAVVGAILNDTYRLNRVIGQGGMGVVFEAAHLRVPRRFAVKVLGREAVANRAIFERFQREAEIASSLGSEHITQVFDFNYADDGTPYMVLELLEGEDLATRLERGAMTLAETVAVVEQVTRALEIAHEHGIIHRDLKPSNVFLCKRPHRPDVVKVLDFGISKVLHGGNQSTRTGLVMGTPSYMAPEQAEGRAGDIDQRTDLFAFGAIIYECLTGKVAFEAPSAVGTIYQVCHAEPAPVRELAPELPRALEQVIARALSKQRDTRYGTARELRNDFVRACSTVGDETMMLVDQYSSHAVRPASLNDRTTLSSAAGASSSSAERDKSVRWWKPAAAVTALAGAAAIAFMMVGSPKSSPRSTRAGSSSALEVDAGVARQPVAPPDAAVAVPPAATIDAGTTPRVDEPATRPERDEVVKVKVETRIAKKPKPRRPRWRRPKRPKRPTPERTAAHRKKPDHGQNGSGDKPASGKAKPRIEETW